MYFSSPLPTSKMSLKCGPLFFEIFSLNPLVCIAHVSLSGFGMSDLSPGAEGAGAAII